MLKNVLGEFPPSHTDSPAGSWPHPPVVRPTMQKAYPTIPQAYSHYTTYGLVASQAGGQACVPVVNPTTTVGCMQPT